MKRISVKKCLQGMWSVALWNDPMSRDIDTLFFLLETNLERNDVFCFSEEECSKLVTWCKKKEDNENVIFCIHLQTRLDRTRKRITFAPKLKVSLNIAFSLTHRLPLELRLRCGYMPRDWTCVLFSCEYLFPFTNKYCRILGLTWQICCI